MGRRTCGEDGDRGLREQKGMLEVWAGGCVRHVIAAEYPSRILDAEKSGWILSWLEQRGGEPEGGLGLPAGRLQSQQLDWHYN